MKQGWKKIEKEKNEKDIKTTQKYKQIINSRYSE